MSKKRRGRRRRPRRYQNPPARPRPRAGGIRLTTPEGDDLVFASTHYRHAAPEDIHSILQGADDFGLDDAMEPEPDGTFHFPWYETRSHAPAHFPSLGQRVLATLTLTPTALEVEAPSRRRLDNCQQRLEQLLEDRIRLVETKVRNVDEALLDRDPTAEPEQPFIPPPEFVAEIEDKMLRQWIDDSIPALGGLTPRQAVKTPEGRRQVLELIEHVGQMQSVRLKTPGMFAPDYRKVKKMLGLE